MRSSWQTKKLSEVCNFYNGLWKGKEPPYIEVGVIRNTNITKEGKLDDSDIAHLKVEKKQFEKRKLALGDIVLEKSGGGPKQPVGRVIIFDKKEGNFSFSNFTSAIRVKDKSELDFNFLHKFLFFSYISGITEGMQSHSTGIRNLDFGAYKEIPIPLPSLYEQRRIVKILDEVFEKIAKAKENTEKNLKNSRELFKSYLKNIFANQGRGWEEKKLGEVCNFQNGFAFKSRLFKPSGFPILRISNIQNDGISYRRLVFFDKSLYKENFDKYQIIKGDLVIAMSGATTGKLAISDANETFYMNQRVGRFDPKNSLSKKYLYYFMSTRIEENLRISSGAAQPNLSTEQIRNFEIPLPTLSEQKSLVKKLDALSAEAKKLEAIYRQKLADLEELKKSVLKRAFNGDL